LGRALAKRIEVHLVNPRDFTTDKHRRVDDEPQGRRRMLLKPEPILPLWSRCRTSTRSHPDDAPGTNAQPLLRELTIGYDQPAIIWSL